MIRWENSFHHPALMAAMMLLFAALPWLSPKRFEVDTFRSTYLYIMVLLVVLLAYLARCDALGRLCQAARDGRSAMARCFFFCC